MFHTISFPSQPEGFWHCVVCLVRSVMTSGDREDGRAPRLWGTGQDLHLHLRAATAVDARRVPLHYRPTPGVKSEMTSRLWGGSQPLHSPLRSSHGRGVRGDTF